MIIIYHATNSLDANLIKGLLAQHNIPAFILGEYLQGAIGELPTSDLIKVAVHETNATEAKLIIQDWESATLLDEQTNFNLSDDAAHGVI